MSSASSPVRIGIIGLGYWGPNLARALASTPGCELAYACDLDEGNRARIEGRYPGTILTDRFDDLLEDDTLDAIVVATGAPSHTYVITPGRGDYLPARGERRAPVAGGARAEKVARQAQRQSQFTDFILE
jgi:predicted homoserine dehydrogenase-like protein